MNESSVLNKAHVSICPEDLLLQIREEETLALGLKVWGEVDHVEGDSQLTLGAEGLLSVRSSRPLLEPSLTQKRLFEKRHS